MRLELALRCLTSLHDLPLLVAALGHEPVWEELPATGWRLAPERVAWGRVARVGQAGGFAWYGVESTEPREAATRISRRLAARGEAAAVVALDGCARRLAVSAGLDGNPAHLEVQLDTPSRLATSCLRRAGLPGTTATGTALQVAEALAGRAVGRDFFRGFGAALETLAGSLPGPVPRADARSVALVQLSRVLFLYFVQSRGWLDGREHFLREELDRTLRARRSVQRDFLAPLFFGTLNRPQAGRSRTAARFGQVPFLNGGLFEPHPLERRWAAGASNDAWRSAFDLVFERFHFTVAEGADEASIAPDMLGRVFEGLMAPEARRRSGTFYTPAALVRRLVARALDAHFGGRGTATLSQLASLTILDPAVGSGAFLLGALEELVDRRREVGDTAPNLRRRVLPGLFGVDRDPMAVRLAELRLWLAVLAEQGDVPPSAVEPLPNLDCLVRQGDSLADPALVLGATPPRQVALTLRQLRATALDATGRSKRAALDALGTAERALLASALTQAEHRLDSEIAQLIGTARGPALFEGPGNLERGAAVRLRTLRARRAEVRRLRRQARGGAVPWFRYEAHFADVFDARGGFDLVLGNPPWVRAEALPVAERRRLRERYRWWRGGAPGTTHQPDLAVAFLERAWELVAPGGTVGMLLPAKLLTAGYAARARGALAREGTVHHAAVVEQARGQRFDAAAYPMAVVASRRPANAAHRVQGALGMAPGAGTAQRTLGSAPWLLLPGDAACVVERLERWPRLGEVLAPQLGVKTGANDVFLDPAAPAPGIYVRPAVRGRDIRPFTAMVRHRLLWPHSHDGAPLAELPGPLRALLEPARDRLAARSDVRGAVPWWSLFRTEAGVAGPRVVWADLAPRLRAVALVDRWAGLVPLNSCYVLRLGTEARARALAAWLNSTWVSLLVAAGTEPARGGYRRFGARAVRAAPLPSSVLDDPVLAATGSGAVDQRALDAHVARVLELDSRDCHALLALAAGRTAPRG